MSFWMFAIFIILLRAVTQCHSECDVLVNDPWPTPFLFVPQESTVRMSCRADSTSPSLFWSIDLASDASDIQLRFDTEGQTLNADGVYQLPKIETSGNSTTLGLLINDTAKNNKTRIFCRRGTLSPLESTLFVLEPAQFKFEVLEQERKAVNLTWSQESSSMVDTPQNFSLTINYSSNSHVISLNESYFYFTAPESAPPCEVYNFFVTAPYSIVGAGAGCSVPSPVLSRMLPSLPDIDEVESTLSYLLTKEPKGGLVLQVLFAPPTVHCSTHIYTLVVTLNESVSYEQLFSQTESTMVANVTPDNLQDNSPFNFKVQVRNSLSGTFKETHITNFYTTDVQNITVAVISDHSVLGMVLVQCDFIPGSDARGCMVVLVGESNNTIVNLTRVGTLLTACGIENLPTTTSLDDVFGFDTESDGTIGTTQVPGIITTVASSTEFDALCQPKKTNDLPLLSTDLIILVSSLAGSILAMVLLIVVSTTIICRYSRKSSAIFQPHQPPAAVNSYVSNHEGMHEVDNQQQDNIPYYDQPELIVV